MDERMVTDNKRQIHVGEKVKLLSTSAVPEVLVGGRVVLAEPLQEEFVVQQAVEGPEEEDVEGQVANPLLLKVSTRSLRFPTGPEEQGPKMS